MKLEISKPWARASDRSKRFAGFFTLANRSDSPDRLISATSSAAKEIAICGIKVVGDGIAMRLLTGGLVVPPATVLTLRPRGYHLRLLGLKALQRRSGASVPVRLTFEKAGVVDVTMAVEAPGPVCQEALFEPR
jgi:copper(I)-binding protein